MRYFIELSYKGTKYHGWQIQPNAITVQEALEQALSTKLQEKIQLVGAGRTDTGVHARFFTAHFDTQKIINEKTVFGVNKLLDNDISVFRIYRVKDNAHARFDAISRTYKYYSYHYKNPFIHEIASFVNFQFDLDLMNKACNILKNYTDFTSFSKLHTDTKTNNCKIFNAYWEKTNEQTIFTIKADRFLRNMVRAITGTLIDLNNKKISLNGFEEIIKAKDRSKAGKSAEARGLHLVDIEYKL
jgi:tRNA pseudouridine38-40 synthase